MATDPLDLIPPTTRMEPTPVMWRCLQRAYGVPLNPPSETEIRQAILLINRGQQGQWDFLWDEACKILDEAAEESRLRL